MTNFTFIARSSFARTSLVFAALLLSSLALFPAHAEQKAPEVVVKETIDAIVGNIQTNRAVYEKDSGALFTMLEETLVPALHVKRMSKQILGKKVVGASTDAQIDAFAEEFKTLLMKTYSSALLNYTGEQEVVYDEVKYRPSGDIAVVKGKLISPDGQKYNVILSMSNRRDTSWRAYNMEVAGFNVLSTYRSSFEPILDKKGLDGLIADLREKNL